MDPKTEAFWKIGGIFMVGFLVVGIAATGGEEGRFNVALGLAGGIAALLAAGLAGAFSKKPAQAASRDSSSGGGDTGGRG